MSEEVCIILDFLYNVGNIGQKDVDVIIPAYTTVTRDAQATCTYHENQLPRHLLLNYHSKLVANIGSCGHCMRPSGSLLDI